MGAAFFLLSTAAYEDLDGVCQVLLTFKEYEIVSDAEAGAPMSVNIGKPTGQTYMG
tara:strand:- start:6386 stop:6553 length:168 start_codon:yes stop_codon:yes gene_type:complete